jgi:hypothetical protein
MIQSTAADRSLFRSFLMATCGASDDAVSGDFLMSSLSRFVTSGITRVDGESLIEGADGVYVADVTNAAVVATGGFTARSLSARAADTVNVLDFFEPDDVDATQAIIRALAVGTTIYFPYNSNIPYAIGSLIELPNAEIEFFGDPGTTLNFYNQGQIVQNNINATGFRNLQMACLNNLPIITLTGPANGIRDGALYNISHCFFYDLPGSEHSSFITLIDAVGGRIADCVFLSSSTYLVDHVLMQSSSVNCSFSNCIFEGFTTRSAIAFVCDTNTTGHQGPRIINCLGTGGANGLYFGGNATCSIGVALISCCMFDSIPNTALYMSNCTGVTLSNCWIAASNSTSAPIVFGPEQCNAITFQGCQIAPASGNLSPYTLDGSANTGGTTVYIMGGHVTGGSTGFADNVTYCTVGVYDTNTLNFSSASSEYLFNPSLNNQAILMPTDGNSNLVLAASGTGTVNTNSPLFVGEGLSLAGSQTIKLSAGAEILNGTTTPSAAAPTGSLYINSSGTTGSTLYVYVAGAWKNLA